MLTGSNGRVVDKRASEGPSRRPSRVNAPHAPVILSRDMPKSYPMSVEIGLILLRSAGV